MERHDLHSSDRWEEISRELRMEFSKISANEDLIENALRMLDAWLTDPIYEPQRAAVLAHIESSKYALLLDSFYQMVPFGTGGRRGRVGYGPNRINSTTVELSVQGHCNYLRETFPAAESPTIVVAFDTRAFSDISNAYDFLGPDHLLLGLTSRALAYQACEIYAGNGFSVKVPDMAAPTAYLSTPELSFLIRHLHALGGINVSASHNHPDDNGFKFYNIEGAQDIPPTDEELTSFMSGVREVKRMAFDEAVEKGVIRKLPAELHEAYIATNLKLQSKETDKTTSIIYTPLSGTGDSTVGDVLRAAGYAVELYRPQATYDGTFSSVPFRLPNPEVPEAVGPALGEAREKGAWMVLSTDPDADRIGVYARTSDGEWRYLTGNDIALILAYYLVRDKKRGPQRSGLIIKTLVTTRALESVAEMSSCKIIPDLLVGFKYIAHVLKCLENEGHYQGVEARPADMVLAAEESHGVLLTPEIRDKDAAGGALVLCELLAQLRQEGSGLPEYLEKISIECGNFSNTARSIVLRGIEGTRARDEMMGSLRNDPFSRIGDLSVLEVEDYLSSDGKLGPLKSETDKLSRNLLLFKLDGAQVVVRPSGTEPKVKLYVDIEGRKFVSSEDRNAAREMAGKLAEIVFDLCIDRIGVRLSPSARLLPDHIDLDLKRDFGEKFSQDLLDASVELAGKSEEERLQWLRKRLSAYGAGADPLEAVGRAVVHLCESLRADTSNPEIQRSLLTIQNQLIK